MGVLKKLLFGKFTLRVFEGLISKVRNEGVPITPDIIKVILVMAVSFWTRVTVRDDAAGELMQILANNKGREELIEADTKRADAQIAVLENRIAEIRDSAGRRKRALVLESEGDNLRAEKIGEALRLFNSSGA
ncbi:MAG: hypothetical protein HYY55_03960 [Candidatus Niyogibacteria bacterium]|nr:MAG: hypothetical protein HYY55_03960 [Candidatus Niyogibacteria bacterium]